MKLLLSLVFSLVNSVAFLLYLSTIDGFLPMQESVTYNWTNIFTVMILVCIGLFSLLGILITLIQLPSKKKISEVSWYLSIKYASVIVLLFLSLGILYFFHLLTWYWVLGILILLTILIFLI